MSETQAKQAPPQPTAAERERQAILDALAGVRKGIHVLWQDIPDGPHQRGVMLGAAGVLEALEKAIRARGKA